MARRKKKQNGFRRFVLMSLALIAILGFALSQIGSSRPNHVTSQSVEQEDGQTREEFLQEIAPIAQEMHQQHGILASIILAQAALESDFGRSLLSAQYNNLFGMKSFGHPQSVTLNTAEFLDGVWLTYDGEFRVYDNWRQSIEDHARLMLNGTTWDPNLYAGVVNANNYVEAAQALQAAGYATDPAYAEKLIEMVRVYNLTRFD